MNVSIVIPAYGRSDKLAATLDALLASETGGLDAVEVIVVDDGSPEPITPVVEARATRPPFALTCIRQPNAGPAAARNNGFRAARGEIVLFVDDDILCSPDLIRRHVEAHQSHPSSVIFGRCPFVEPDPMTPFFRYLDSLGNDPGKGAREEFVPTAIVASGQLSVERAMFDADQGVYRDDLATPAAEEYELSLRLRERGIPVLIATRIVALHNHAVDIEGICRQAYKHSMGCAEAALKYPRTLDLAEVREIIQANGPTNRTDSPLRWLKKSLKRALSSGPSRAALFGVTRALERSVPVAAALSPLYKALLSIHMQRGARDGLAAYSCR